MLADLMNYSVLNPVLSSKQHCVGSPDFLVGYAKLRALSWSCVLYVAHEVQRVVGWERCQEVHL